MIHWGFQGAGGKGGVAEQAAGAWGRGMVCRKGKVERQAENVAPQWDWLLKLPVRGGGRSAAYIS